MKKKITLLVILAAIMSLSSCILLWEPETTGTLNVYIDYDYQNYYYIGNVYIKQGGDWVEVWDAVDHPKTYFKEVHVNLEEGWYDVKFDIYKCRNVYEEEDSYYDDEYEYNVRIRGGKATNFKYNRNGISYKY